MRRPWTRLRQDERGTVAPTVALSLIALLATGGLAFDYAHLAALDSELQNAADQAALAAATQLDGQLNACARASAAAVSLLSNRTLMANENTSRAITVTSQPSCTGTGSLEFYQSYNQTNDTFGAAATGDSNAKVVRVRVNGREAVYALTPIFGALRSGTINAEATATLNSSICKVPPLMMCNPAETTDPSFNVSNYVGKGIALVEGDGTGGGSYTAGDWGFLDHTGGASGDSGLRQDLGWTTPPGDCQAATGVDTKPGKNSVADAINTRFDIYDSTCESGGACPASINSVKDVVRDPTQTGNNICKLTLSANPKGWHLSSNYYGKTIPTSTTALPVGTTPDAMGHPRDMCHAVSSAGTCSGGRIGSGSWDRDAYFRTNYVRTSTGSSGQAVGTRWTSSEWQANTLLSPTVATTAANYASRYNVYQWEVSKRGTTVDGVSVLGSRTVVSPDTSYGLPQCSSGQGFTPIVPTNTTVDRRRFSVAVVNCSMAANGGTGQVKGNSTNVVVTKWVNVFLVEPSVTRARTSDKDAYVEVIDETLAGGSSTTSAQLIRHDVPYLLK